MRVTEIDVASSNAGRHHSRSPAAIFTRAKQSWFFERVTSRPLVVMLKATRSNQIVFFLRLDSPQSIPYQIVRVASSSIVLYQPTYPM